MSAAAHNSLGLYLSIPFCRSKCTYCNFASGVYPASEHARYVDRLIADMAAAPQWATGMDVYLPRTVDTVYLGGGTPSVLSGPDMARLFAAMCTHFRLTPDAEITVECAPGQISDETLAALAASGVNRVSLGVQSFIDKEAASSGRLHTRAIVLNDLARLRAAGISNINLDLLAGLAGQTLASWQESLAVLTEAGTPHASVYMLEIDEDSRLGRELLSGGARYHADLVPSDDTIAGFYETALETLAANGLHQYEISNFARTSAAISPDQDPTFASRHNLRYWQRLPYLGLGLDASSMLLAADGTALRATTTSDLAAYLEGPPANFDPEHPGTPETGWLSPTQQLEEAWFLGLRRNAGVDIAALRREFGPAAVAPAEPILHRLAQDGLLTLDGNRVRLTDCGRLLSNDAFAEFLGLSAHVEADRPPFQTTA